MACILRVCIAAPVFFGRSYTRGRDGKRYQGGGIVLSGIAVLCLSQDIVRGLYQIQYLPWLTVVIAFPKEVLKYYPRGTYITWDGAQRLTSKHLVNLISNFSIRVCAASLHYLLCLLSTVCFIISTVSSHFLDSKHEWDSETTAASSEC